jgi:hypothetical protein
MWKGNHTLITAQKTRGVAHVNLFRDVEGGLHTEVWTTRGTIHKMADGITWQANSDEAPYFTRVLLNEVWPYGWWLDKHVRYANGTLLQYTVAPTLHEVDEDTACDFNQDDGPLFRLCLEDVDVGVQVNAMDRHTEMYPLPNNYPRPAARDAERMIRDVMPDTDEETD